MPRRTLFAVFLLSACGHRQNHTSERNAAPAATSSARAPTFFVGGQMGIEEMTHDLPDCLRRWHYVVGLTPSDFPYRLEGNRLLREEVVVETPATDQPFAGVTMAPSGRFEVMIGNLEEMEFTHWQGMVLDRQEGKLYLIPPAGALIPFPLRQASHFRRDDLRSRGARDLSWETTLRWPDSDHLLVDRTLYKINGGAIELPGDVAPRLDARLERERPKP